MDAAGKKLFVASTQGPSSLDLTAASQGRSAGQSLGTVSIIELPTSKQLVQWTQQVKQNNKMP